MDKNPSSNAATSGVQAGGVKAPARPSALAAQGGAPMPNPVAIVRRAFAHWPAIAATMVLGVIVTVLVVQIRKPTFKSETVVFYRQSGFKSDSGPGEDLRLLGNKYKELVLAQSNLKKVIEDCRAFQDVVDKRGLAEAIDQMRKKVDFKTRSLDTFAISFQGTSRDEAQRCAAKIAELLVAEDHKLRANNIRGQTEFLEAEKKRTDEEVERAEKELAAFMAEHPEFAGEVAGKTGVSIRAEIDRGVAARRAAQKPPAPGRPRPAIGAAPSPAAIAEDGVDPALVAAKAQAANELAAARKDHADKSLRYTDQHPELRAAAARVAAAEAAFRIADDAVAKAQAALPAKKPAPPADDPAKRAPVAVRVSHGDEAAKTPAQKAENPGAEVVMLETEWSRLNRAAASARVHQSDLEAKLFKAAIVASSESNGYGAQLVVLDPAFKPGAPSSLPNKTVFALGFVISLLVGLLISAAWGMFLDDRVFHASELEILGDGVALLGVVPRARPLPRRGARA